MSYHISWDPITGKIIERHEENEMDQSQTLYELGITYERERILAMKKDIINCVIDYGLTPEKYERICNDIDALIKGESKEVAQKTAPHNPQRTCKCHWCTGEFDACDCEECVALIKGEK